MKLAICNETFQDWPFERAFDFAKECGYEGIEFAPFTIHNDARQISATERSKIRGQVESRGLQTVGLHWLLAFTEGYYLTTPDTDVRRKTAAYLGELAQLCRDLGGEVLVLGSPKQRNLMPGVSHAEGVRYAVDVLQQAMPAFERTQTVLAVEPLGPQEGDFLLTADAGAELVRAVASPHCKLHLDVKAMSSESTPIPENIRQHQSLLAHFHANDANRRGPGMGEIDFVPILRTLKEIGYDQWVSVEVFDYTPGVESLARDSAEYLRRCLAQI